MKIIGWNINHRVGYSKINMPKWVKSVITDKNADVIVLTEVSFKVPNFKEEYQILFNRYDYFVFSINYNDFGFNEVIISIKKNCFEVKYFKSFISNVDTYPDHLEITCVDKKTGEELVIVGMRMHATKPSEENNYKKNKKFKKVLESLEHKDNVIIVGDFNNYRRGFSTKYWCLDEVKKLADKYGFEMFTPNGGSINEDNNNGDYSFPVDHILAKGNSLKVTKLYDYDRSFTNKEKNIYVWNSDFQRYCGKDDRGKNIYDKISDPFPDHAIIEADFQFTEKKEQ